MGLLKSIFGARSSQDDAVEAMRDHVDPETGFSHSWSDEERHDFCTRALERLQAELGGELRMAEDEVRLSTTWGERDVVVGADGFTGDLVVSITGQIRLGPIGLLRDAELDEPGLPDDDEQTPEGWSEDSALAGDVREYVAQGIYFETPKQQVEFERQRFAALPDALRAQILDAMQHARLQSIFATDGCLDLTWERCVFREGDLARVVRLHLDLAVAVLQVIESTPDPDPSSPNAAQRCPYCGQKYYDQQRSKCDNCGGVL